MTTFDKIEERAQRRDKIRIRCINIPDDMDPPLTDRAVKKFKVARLYDAEYMIDSKMNSGWIIAYVPFKKYEVGKYFEVIE